MAKPTLFWTLRPHWWAGGFDVMRVTTEKPRRLYGSTRDGETTHALSKDCRGRFATQAEAEAIISRVTRVRNQHAENIMYLTAARIAAERLQREAIEAVIEGRDPEPPPTPISLVNRAQANQFGQSSPGQGRRGVPAVDVNRVAA